MEALSFPNIKVVAIIAEGVPERYTLKLIKTAQSRPAERGGPVTIIGPATVGGIKPGCFRIGMCFLNSVVWKLAWRDSLTSASP